MVHITLVVQGLLAKLKKYMKLLDGNRLSHVVFKLAVLSITSHACFDLP